MSDNQEQGNPDRAADNDDDAETLIADGEPGQDDEQEIAIDAVLAETERDPAGDDE